MHELDLSNNGIQQTPHCAPAAELSAVRAIEMRMQ